MNVSASLLWFARHEIKLSWRDLYGMISGNRAGRAGRIAIVLLAVAAGLHLLSWSVLDPVVKDGLTLDLKTLALISGFLLLPISLMASQAMESITRAFYTRSDLELIIASPAPTSSVFAIRMLAVAFATSALTLLVSAPAINVLAMIDNPTWLFAYPVIIGFGLVATAFAILLTMGLFLMIGPARTRLIAQIAAAVVGAGFVIGIQLVAIASIGTISRVQLLQSPEILAKVPGLDSPIWIPAMGASGDLASALIVFGIGLVLFLATIVATAGSYGDIVLRAASIDLDPHRANIKTIGFRDIRPAAVMRRKEWKLLLRDKWLLSQTLMQLLYLIPPAYMLWQGFGNGSSPEMVVVPVIVMAAGQLSGGLAWLAISGEDAPELVATAPVLPGNVIRAKVEAILIAVAIAVAPLVILTMVLSLKAGMIAIIAIAASVCSATAIQLWFKVQAKRSNFRRRQTSSRVATIAEALSSILWAGFAGIWIAGSGLAVAVALFVLGILWTTWLISPARHQEAMA